MLFTQRLMPVMNFPAWPERLDVRQCQVFEAVSAPTGLPPVSVSPRVAEVLPSLKLMSRPPIEPEFCQVPHSLRSNEWDIAGSVTRELVFENEAEGGLRPQPSAFGRAERAARGSFVARLKACPSERTEGRGVQRDASTDHPTSGSWRGRRRYGNDPSRGRLGHRSSGGTSAAEAGFGAVLMARLKACPSESSEGRGVQRDPSTDHPTSGSWRGPRADATPRVLRSGCQKKNKGKRAGGDAGATATPPAEGGWATGQVAGPQRLKPFWMWS